jgi:hypothetical protein
MSLHPDKTVERREPAKHDLECQETFVVDVGEEYSPARLNFDHHQEGAPEGKCAFSLLADSRLSIFTPDLQPWIDVTNKLDCFGPFKLAESLGIRPDVLFSLMSPIEEAILEIFQSKSTIEPEEPLAHVMRSIGDTLRRNAADLSDKLEVARQLVDKAVPVGTGMLAVVLHDTMDPAMSKALDLARKNDRRIAVCICRDDRGPGWTLYRYDDHEGVDFYRLQGMDEVTFCHPGGFIAKTKEMTITEAIELAKEGTI